MKRRNSFIYVLVLVTFLASTFSFAQKDPKEENKSKMEKVNIPANTIDFKAQLGSDTYALEQLGTMIENGRKYADINSLLSASMVLFLAEKNTGKTAQISALALLKEATDLAKTQKNVKAAKNCADVWGNPMFGNDSKQSGELVSLAKSFEEEIASTRGPGAKVVDVKVENYTDYGMYVYIDGVYKGYIASGYYVVYQNIGTGWTSFYTETDDIWSSSQGKYVYYYWSNSYNLTDYDYTSAADFVWSVY